MASLSGGGCILSCLDAGETNALAVAVGVSWETPKMQGAAGGEGAGLRFLRVQTVCARGNGDGRPGDGKTLSELS